MQGISLEQADTSQTLLLRSVAEQLKTPLMYVARQAELSKTTRPASPEQVFSTMQLHADMALKLVDSYLLGLAITNQQETLDLEPVPLSAVLYDVAHDLTPIARQYNTDVELVLAGKYGQVMAHQAGLKAALYGLGFVLSEIVHPQKTRNRLQIAAHRSRQGIVTGFYIDGAEQMQTELTHMRRTRGTFKRQPFAQCVANTGAGVLVADAIFTAMQTRLRSGRFRSQQGLAVTLQQSKQLQLV